MAPTLDTSPAPAGPTTRWDAARYAATGRFVSDLSREVVDLLDPRPGERILDLGCGDGALTQRMADAGVSVVGVDASTSMVAAAASRGVDARVCDARALPFEAEFDAVFSNAVLHWIPETDAGAVLEGVARALVPGGRFVAEFGGKGNIAAIHVALMAACARRGVDWRALRPWYYPSADAYGARLEAHGFEVHSIELVPRPTRLPSSMADWLGTFAVPWLDSVPAQERGALVEEVVALLEPALRCEDGSWTADYVRLRFRASIPRR
jgi:trans-aconitate methyltransferase